jgi:hypothetical protein
MSVILEQGVQRFFVSLHHPRGGAGRQDLATQDRGAVQPLEPGDLTQILVRNHLIIRGRLVVFHSARKRRRRKTEGDESVHASDPLFLGFAETIEAIWECM